MGSVVATWPNWCVPSVQFAAEAKARSGLRLTNVSAEPDHMQAMPRPVSKVAPTCWLPLRPRASPDPKPAGRRETKESGVPVQSAGLAAPNVAPLAIS